MSTGNEEMHEKIMDKILSKVLWRPGEVAELISVSVSGVYDLVKDGELHAHCSNGVRRKPMKILSVSIINYIEKHIIEPKEWRQ